MRQWNKGEFREGRVVRTAVDSLEASVISKFPFSPSRAGTRMKISLILVYTSQC